MSLLSQLSQRAQLSEGLLSVDKVMEAALFDPEFGYYSAQIKGVGRGGDFSTSASLHPLLSRAIAQWANKHESSPFLKPLPLIEVGAGDGSLAKGILDHLSPLRKCRDIFSSSYHIVDVSPPLRTLQKQKLGRRAQWHSTVLEALAATEGRGFIVANELIDAFPCAVFEWNKSLGQWDEVFLKPPHSAEDHWAEEVESTTPERAQIAEESWQGEAPHDRQRIELQLGFPQWLSEWSSQFKEGRILLIDYGEDSPDLYYRRPAGSLRAYFQHLLLEGLDVWARLGKQDITADVNFTWLKQVCEQSGFKVIQQQSQGDFIDRALAYEIEALENEPSPEESFLMQRGGAADAFQVLELAPKAS